MESNFQNPLIQSVTSFCLCEASTSFSYIFSEIFNISAFLNEIVRVPRFLSARFPVTADPYARSSFWIVFVPFLIMLVYRKAVLFVRFVSFPSSFINAVLSFSAPFWISLFAMIHRERMGVGLRLVFIGHEAIL